MSVVHRTCLEQRQVTSGWVQRRLSVWVEWGGLSALGGGSLSSEE